MIAYEKGEIKQKTGGTKLSPGPNFRLYGALDLTLFQVRSKISYNIVKRR